jgi:alpha-1,6-mannosyltransferase
MTIGLHRVLAIAGAAVIAWSLVRLARAGGVDPLAATWLALASPLVAVHLLSAAHHDALLAGLVVAGLAIATHPRTAVKAGAVLGLAAAIKVTAVIALPFAFLLLARRGKAAAGLAGSAAVAFAAASAVTGLGLGWVRGLPDTSRVVQWTSVPTGVGMAVRYLAGGSTAIAVARIAGLVVLVAVLVALWLRAARSAGDVRTVVTYSGLAFAATALLSPVFFPWYAVVPLALLAAAVADRRMRWRLAAGVAALSFLILPDGHGVASLTKVPGAIADVLLVVAAVVWAWRHRDRLPKMQRVRRVVDATR